MPLLLNNAVPLHWAVAGAGIAGITLVLLFVSNRRLGISSVLEDACSLAISGPYFRRSAVLAGRPWRLPFVAGLACGGFISAMTSGGWSPTANLGMFDQVIGLGIAGKLAWMFVAGLFIGFGTRLGGGCTSGHGIFGIANFEMPSLVTTASFMVGGIATTQIVYHLIF